ncbi:MAG: hypothetical protein EX271_01710 [Acidimicrobiales bacterium]|nr:hypothetical protein [Hyphomonadaceae bacterium]RZV44428.1 MAG: hypothetical protein EX271_01710 [Acidimicrobiales bacterium]
MSNKTNKSVCAKLSLFSISAAMVAVMAQSAHAVDVDGQAVFSGLILDSCTVNVLNPGLLGVATDQAKLSSEEIGGAPAAAAIVTNSNNSSVQVLPPLAFETAPVGSDVNTVFTTKYNLSGSTTADEPDGNNLTPLGLGASAMVVNAAAEKTEGTYNGGQYSFVTTVRCVTP